MTVTRRKLSVDEFRRAFETGVYSPDERLELLQGEVWVMTPIGRKHTAAVNRLNTLFNTQLGGRIIVSIQNGLALSPRDLPQPDVVLLRWRDDYYAGKDVEAADALLVVEVADSTLTSDRTVKLPLYAAAGVPEVWIVNLQDDVTEISSEPAEDAYRHTRTVPFGTAFAPQAFPEQEQIWLDG